MLGPILDGVQFQHHAGSLIVPVLEPKNPDGIQPRLGDDEVQGLIHGVVGGNQIKLGVVVKANQDAIGTGAAADFPAALAVHADFV